MKRLFCWERGATKMTSGLADSIEPKNDPAIPAGATTATSESASATCVGERAASLTSRSSSTKAAVDSFTRLDKHKQLRAYIAAVVVLGACGLWYVTLSKLGASNDGLPWYLTIGIIGVVCARHVARPRPIKSALEIRQPGSRAPVSLLESWAVTYTSVSIALYAWVSMQALIPPEEPRKLVQFVDIKLVSDEDFADRQSPMPGTEDQKEEHRRDSDITTAQGSLSATKVAEIARQSHNTDDEQAAPPPASLKKSERQKPNHQTQMPERLVLAHNKNAKLMAVPQQKQRNAIAKSEPSSKPQQEQADAPMKLIQPILAQHPKASQRSPHSEPVFEEVQPPELVEMVENDGSRDSNVTFEVGGHTDGGTGQANDLNTYIKDLHKRIRSAWSPPHGQSRKAKLLFRIKKDGRLAFIKLIASSGDNDTDTAALKAVTTIPHKSLPDSYSFPYLDVLYTFKYAADEMTEVRTQISDQ